MLIRIGIRIQHFKSMGIRIQIQGFDDQKLEKFTAENITFLDKKNYNIARPP
jgi:hypothetical protein